jgi:DHA3 family macrolide efflux protein-like MFS transporter
MQGRVFTLIGSLATAATPISLLFAGPLSDAFGVQSWYVAGGLVTVLIGATGFFIRSVMTIETGHPDTVKTGVGLATK